MPDGFGLLPLVSEPMLERVVKEQRIAREHPRRHSDQQAECGSRGSSRESGSGEETDVPVTPNHIDLRI